MELCGHLDLDGAWPIGAMNLPRVEARQWGPRLRYTARAGEAAEFARTILNDLPPFVLYGSGDFHYLAGMLVARFGFGGACPRDGRTPQAPPLQHGPVLQHMRSLWPAIPLTLIAFDNHPDWDIRPPRWACGGWMNRALEMSHIRRASVWGCGNFELSFPSVLFANHLALRERRLEVHAWVERQTPRIRRRFACMSRENWRERFEQFVGGLSGEAVYITVDLDCLNEREAVTNWENGLFTAEDVAWALGLLHRRARIVVGGDLCGARSMPVYARRFQRFAGTWDHPNLSDRSEDEAHAINLRALETIWPALVGEG